MLRVILVTALAASLLAACGTPSEKGAPPMRRNDKLLTCDELLLELNDARFLQKQAMENKGMNFKNIVWPVGYPATYQSAEEAIDQTGKRIEYLSNIYTIKKCDQGYPPRQ